MEVYTGYSGHSSDSVNHRAKRMGAARGRSEVDASSINQHKPQKNAIRVCGNWSEQLSSKGKIYFYNCVTEVSQWQKPPEWKLPDMDHDELLRLLGSRNQNENKSLKRSRVSASASVNSRDLAYSAHLSPKRTKFSPDLRNRTQTATRKISPSPLLDTPQSNAGFPSRPSNQHTRSHPHLSPKRNHDRRAYPVPSRRHVSTNGPLKLHPADDMDISPNSSPMSGCSGSSRSAINNNSPHFPKCARSDYGRCPSSRTVYDPAKSRGLDVYNQESTQADKPGTLRHLVDAIRASIGGLLSQSPSTTTVRSTEFESPTNAHPELRNRSAFPANRDELPQESRYTGSPCGSIDRQKCQGQFWPPRSLTGDSSSVDPQVEVNQPCLRADGPPHLLPDPPRELRTVDVQTRDVPGLVSTLTTLVSLIGSAKYRMPSSHIQSAPSSTALLPTPGQRSPTSHHVSTSQRRSTVSPLMPSPLTPSLQTNTSTSECTSNTIAQSLLSSSLPPQQVDEFLSSLENLAQKARYRPSKPPTIEYYQPSRSQPNSGERFDPVVVHTDYSDRSSDSPSAPNQNCTGLLPHPKQFDVPNCSTRLSDTRLQLDQYSESTRSISDSLNDDGSCHAPTKREVTRDLPSSRDNQNSPNCAVLNPLPGSSVSAHPPHPSSHVDPALNRSGDHLSSSPDERPDDECLMKVARILDSPTTQTFVDSTIVAKFTDKAVERLEQEALVEGRKFEKLQSVLYGELSVESKKLRALVRISEAKLAIHREKQTALQELMDAIETRRQLPNLSFSDDVI